MGQPTIMDEQDLIFEKRGRMAYITLDCPQALNALSKKLKHELEAAVARIEADDGIWGVIITGHGKAFSSGTDISEFPATVEEARRITAYSQALFNRIENLGRSVIAAINGFALGGGLELALACDIRVASERAKLGFPEVKICAIPCYGGTQRLTRLVGAGRAKEMIYTGAMITAQEALDMGLVNHVVPAGDELAKAEDIMDVILQNAPMAVAYAKLCIDRGPEVSLDYALGMEQDLVSMLVPTHDMSEGTRAFLEKRPPVFQNK